MLYDLSQTKNTASSQLLTREAAPKTERSFVLLKRTVNTVRRPKSDF